MASEKREIEIALRSRGAEASADRLNKKVQGIGSSADSAENSMLSLTRVAAAVGSALATNQVIAYADAWTNVNNRLRSATSNSLEFTRAQQGVLAIAQQAGVDLSGVADGYSRIAQNTAELGISQERLLDVTRKVTLAIKAGGATAQEASSVIVQLGQGLGAGALQGDELRSIMEASIPITKALAKEFGVTTGELKKLGSEGKITADRVISAIEGMDESAITFTKDISSGFTEVNNALTVYVGNLDESFAASENIAGVMSGLAANIDKVVEAVGLFVQVGAAIYITNLTKSVIANTAAFAQNQAAIISSNTVLATGATVSKTYAATTWALTYAMRALKAALPFGAIFIGLEIMQRMLTATNDQISANDRYAESTRKLNARLETRAEKERAIALRTAAEVNVRNQDRLSDQLEKIEAQRQKLEKANAANAAKLRGEQYKEEEALTLFQITKVQNRIKVMEEEARRLEGIAKRSSEAFAKIQNSIAAESSAEEITKGAFVDPSQRAGAALDKDLDNFFEQEKNEKPPEPKGAGSDFVNRIKLETQAYAAELEIRRQLNEGSITERQASDALELQNILFSYEAKRQAILEQEFQTEQLKQEALQALREQELTSIRLFEEEKTNIKSDGDEQRLNLEKSYSQQVQAMQIAVAKQAVNLIRGFVGESKKTKIALIALDKGLAIAQTIINSQVASTRALAELGPLKGAPVSAKMLSLGKISAGIIAATGLGEAFASSGGGGSIGSIGSSAPSAPSASFAPAPSVQNQTQQRTINITGLDGIDDDQPIPLTVGGLKSLLSSDENVNIAINQGQQNAQRVGAI